MPQITEKQFDVMVKLMRGNPSSPTNSAARQVLVHGVKQVDARLQLGADITRGAVCNAVRRYEKANERILEAYAESGDQMTEAQYKCLVKLMRGTLSARVNIIARRVLVEGMTTSQAKKDMKDQPGRASISAAVNRYRNAHQSVRDAYPGAEVSG